MPQATVADDTSRVPTRWVWWTAVLFGGVAPLLAGLRARHGAWIAWGAVAVALQVAGLALGGLVDDADRTSTSLLGGVLYVCGWGAGLGFPAPCLDAYRRRVAELDAGGGRGAVAGGR